MTNKQLYIGISPINGSIFIGNLLEDGRTWASNKIDVTIDALCVVIEHTLMFKKRTGKNVVISMANAGHEYEIIIKKL